MVTPTTITTTGQTIVDHPKPVIKIAADLNVTTEKPFVTNKNLHLDRLRMMAGPAMSSAGFHYTHGKAASFEEAAAGFVLRSPLDLIDKVVRIEIRDTVDSSLDPTVWHGIIEFDERNVWGGTAGRQSFTAYGPERWLEKVFVDSAVIDVEGSPIRHGRALPFNVERAGGAFPQRGNLALETPVAHAFSARPPGGLPGDADVPALWTARTAVEYLLEHHVPVDSDGNKIYEWKLTGQKDALNWYDISVQTEGRTTRDVLNQLIPRHRMVGYTVEVEFDEESDPPVPTINVRIFSFSETQIDLPEDPVPANTNQVILDFDDAVNINPAIVTNAISHRYAAVRCQGEWRTSTFTLGFGPGLNEMQRDWTTAQQTSFLEAASEATTPPRDPPYDEISDKARANALRRAEDDLAGVFSRFRIDEGWAMRGRGGTANTIVAPKLSDDTAAGTVLEEAQPWSFIRRAWLPRTPLKVDVDYSDDRIATGDFDIPASNFLAPFVFINTSNIFVAGTDVFELIDRLAVTSGSDSNPRSWSAHVTTLTALMGVELRVSSGAQQMLATAEFSLGAAKTDDRSDPAKNNGLEYITAEITGTAELDSRAEVVHRLSEPEAGEQVDELLIYVPGMRLDYVVPGTVVAVKDGKTITSMGGFVRDERNALERIAKLAGGFYSRDRQALELSWGQLRLPVDENDDRLAIGHLVVQIGALHNRTQINSVVTAIEFRMGNDKGTTSIQTQFAEADFR